MVIRLNDKCPRCGDAGDFFRDMPHTEVFHYSQRAVWSLHKHRQALRAQGHEERAIAVSRLISVYEAILDAAKTDDMH